MNYCSVRGVVQHDGCKPEKTSFSNFFDFFSKCTLIFIRSRIAGLQSLCRVKVVQSDWLQMEQEDAV